MYLEGVNFKDDFNMNGWKYFVNDKGRGCRVFNFIF